MNHRSDTVNRSNASEINPRCHQMNGNGDKRHLNPRGKNNNFKEMQEMPECVRTEPPLSTVITRSGPPRPHQRRWSFDLSKMRNSKVGILRKKKKQPQVSQHGIPPLRPYAAAYSSSKRYSCPPMGTSASPRPSSSSSFSSTSSCSSPPPVKTSVITGHDPLGWKLRPKSGTTSSRARANRLSLQIVLPIIPDPQTPKPAPSPAVRPDPRPKPPLRHHSDTSALIRSVEALLPVVTLEDLRAVKLHSTPSLDESDDVFAECDQEEGWDNKPPCKIPPPVPEKTATARQIAQLIARSHQRWRAIPRQDEVMFASVVKLQPKIPRAGQ